MSKKIKLAKCCGTCGLKRLYTGWGDEGSHKFYCILNEEQFDPPVSSELHYQSKEINEFEVKDCWVKSLSEWVESNCKNCFHKNKCVNKKEEGSCGCWIQGKEG